MKILIDIGHPASVHFFSQMTLELINKGHDVLFTTREKDVSLDLLNYYKFNYVSFGKTPRSFFLKVLNIFVYSYKILKISIRFKPDLFFTRGAYYLFLSSLVLRKPIISNLNTDVSKINHLLHKFPDCLMTPQSFKYSFNKKKHIRYPGNCELALLHPNRYKPDKSVLSRYNISDDDRLILVRFVSFVAFDDYGQEGVSSQKRESFVKELAKYGKVIVSSEELLSGELKKYHLEQNSNYQTGDLQHLEYYAELFLGDSGAMTAECAVLGTPSIYISTKRLGFVDELVNKYDLAYQYSNHEEALNKGIELLKTPGLKQKWAIKKERFISDSIDLTKFMVWLIENYPQSKKQTIENPSVFLNFK